MDRQDLIKKAYNRVSSLSISNPEYQKRVLAFTEALVEEDIGNFGDITSDSVFEDLNPQTSARLIAKDSGICAGLEEAAWFYRRHGIEATLSTNDGEKISKGKEILTLRGSCKDLLRTERMGLNLIQRMSGIATLTNELVQKMDRHELHVAATRKTPWGSLDKKAVAVGKGVTHRLGLWDFILIKENHLTVLKQNGFGHDYIEVALERAVHSNKTSIVEIEVQNQQEAVRAAEAFQNHSTRDNKIFIIMLDNFSPAEIKDTLGMIGTKSDSKNILYEASGNITPENINQYAEAGVDVVSMGYLTHSPAAFDISQLHAFGI